MRLILACASIVLSMAGPVLADAGHQEERAYGRPGEASHDSRTIEVRMIETSDGMSFEPKGLAIKKGDQVRFVIVNGGELDHELLLGTLEENLKHAAQMAKNPDMEHDDPNAIRLSPGADGEILWQFTKAGTFDFSCLIPGHREAGMFGTIVVQ